MTMQMTEARPRGRSFLRSAGAVFAGLVTIFVLSLATDQLFHGLGIYPGWGQPMRDTRLLLLSILGAIEMWDFGPNWYPVVLAASALPSAWLGGFVHALTRPA